MLRNLASRRTSLDPKGSFRGWLRTVAVNKATDIHRRETARPEHNRDAGNASSVVVADHVDLLEEADYNRYIAARALATMKAEFREDSWQACWKNVVEGQSIAEVAQELGISENAVRVAKCRILRRLREELKGFLE